MATQPAPVAGGTVKLELAATFRGMRTLAWDRDILYASRGYTLYSAQMSAPEIIWHPVASYRPEWWRNLTRGIGLTSRLVRDGIHALAILPTGNLVAAVPGAIATLRAGETEFRISHRLVRGTRPLHIATTPDGRVFWGEYFDNAGRDEVHVYWSQDDGLTWNIAHTFGKGCIRHVHNIVYDQWDDCLWILTGDHGSECQILRSSLDFSLIDEVVTGNQQARAVAAVVTQQGLYFASDTPLERNYIYCLDRHGRVDKLFPLPSSSIYGCKNRSGIFFSTMVEPSEVNRTQWVSLFGSDDGSAWQPLANWRKDHWSMKFFQYGNAFLPDGENTTNLLAVSTLAVEGPDLQTCVWRTSAS
jgi:hypothetical protein